MQKTDIVPDLKKRIENTYRGLIESDESLKRLTKKIHEAGAWEDAQEYAGKIGQHRSASFLENISVEELPNGQMYYNIANRIIRPELINDFELISAACMEVQEQANQAANIGIRAQKPDLNTDRIDGIVNRISSEPFEKVKFLLGAPIENFMRSVVDDHVEGNADFQYEAGLNPVIRRTTDGKCCEWCTNLAGEYPYKPGMNREVFRRHENCGCTVAYYPDVKSKERQDVWNKKWDGEKQNQTKEPLKEIEHRAPLNSFLEQHPEARKVHEGKQSKHMRGSPNFDASKSEISISLQEAQAFLEEGIKSGEMMFGKSGVWENKVRLRANRSIGIYKDIFTGKSEETDTFVIHFSKKGAHLVPGRPSDEFRASHS